MHFKINSRGVKCSNLPRKIKKIGFLKYEIPNFQCAFGLMFHEEINTTPTALDIYKK
jgi:hypothetical protein